MGTMSTVRNPQWETAIPAHLVGPARVRAGLFEYTFSFLAHADALAWACWMAESHPDFVHYRVHAHAGPLPPPLALLFGVPAQVWVVHAKTDLAVRQYVVLG